MGKQQASPLAIVIAIVVLLVVLFAIFKLTVGRGAPQAGGNTMSPAGKMMMGPGAGMMGNAMPGAETAPSGTTAPSGN